MLVTEQQRYPFISSTDTNPMQVNALNYNKLQIINSLFFSFVYQF